MEINQAILVWFGIAIQVHNGFHQSDVIVKALEAHFRGLRDFLDHKPVLECIVDNPDTLI